MIKIKNRIKELIEQKEAQLDGFKFNPSNAWYYQKRISKKRFSKILANQIVPDIEELNTIAQFLGVASIMDLLVTDSNTESPIIG